MGGLKGRKHRINRFEARAENFARDILKRENIASITRDDLSIIVGRGKNKRLISKRRHPTETNVPHLAKTLLQQEQFQKAIIAGRIVPKHYVFVQVRGIITNAVHAQEYFHKPTVNELEKFLFRKLHGKDESNFLRLNKEEWFLCKQFVNQHLGKNLKKEKLEDVYDNLISAYNEFDKHMSYSSRRFNTVVMGFTKDGKVRLAIVDV